MSISSARITVTTTATELVPWISTFSRSVLVKNRGTVSVFLGNADVTASTGYELLPDEYITIDLSGSKDLFAVTSSSTALCHVLQVGAV